MSIRQLEVVLSFASVRIQGTLSDWDTAIASPYAGHYFHIFGSLFFLRPPLLSLCIRARFVLVLCFISILEGGVSLSGPVVVQLTIRTK